MLFNKVTVVLSSTQSVFLSSPCQDGHIYLNIYDETIHKTTSIKHNILHTSL